MAILVCYRGIAKVHFETCVLLQIKETLSETHALNRSLIIK